MADVLLVQMPFQSIRRPSIGLSLLRGVLTEAGHRASIRYLNIEYARRIGLNLYTTISEALPADALFGDLVFSPAWFEADATASTVTQPDVERYLAYGKVPAWLGRLLPELADEAVDMVRTESDVIARSGVDLVGFNTTFNLSPSLAVCRYIKRHRSGPRTVLGGASCEGVMGEAVLRSFSYVDFVCRGEGERPLAALADWVDAGCADGVTIAGMLSRTWPAVPGPVLSGQDLEKLPVPRYEDWFKQHSEAGLGLSSSELLMPIETSRGCWYGAQRHCTFCGLNGDNLQFRSKGPEAAMREFESLLTYGVKNIHAVDNVIDSKYFRTFLPDLVARRHPARIFYEIRAKVTHDQLDLMRRAGVRTVQPGIESLSTPVLNLMRKGVMAYHNIRLLKWCEELGIAPTWNLLYGFPGEDRHDYLEMIGLLPLLCHLPPPAVGHVRLDRFSPLHSDGPSLGITDQRPASTYEMIYDLPVERLADLAYYFDFSSDNEPDATEYGAALRAAVGDWHRDYATSALIRVDHGDTCWVFDTRPSRLVSRAELDLVAADVLRRAERGVRADRLLSESVGPLEEIRRAVATLVKRGWLIAVDGRLLSVAVDYTRLIPPSMSPILIEDFCLGVAATRHREACNAVIRSKDGLRVAQAEGELLRSRVGTRRE